MAMRKAPKGSVGYFFCNHYMQGIHGGIQSLHAGMLMALDYPPGKPGFDVLEGWVRSASPDAIVLNAGYASSLEEVALTIEAMNAENNEGTQLPYARFHEGIDELNGALTAVSLVVPEKWMIGDYTVDPAELAEVLDTQDPVLAARDLKHWPMGDRLRLLRHGMPWRT